MTEPTRYYGGVEPTGDYDQLVAKIDEQAARLAFLEAANEAGEANYQTIKALLKEVGDAKLALETERDAARAAANEAANVAFAMRDEMARENARLLNALTIVTPALEAAMEMLPDDDAMPFVRTLGYCILLLEEKATPPTGAGSDANRDRATERTVSGLASLISETPFRTDAAPPRKGPHPSVTPAPVNKTND